MKRLSLVHVSTVVALASLSGLLGCGGSKAINNTTTTTTTTANTIAISVDGGSGTFTNGYGNAPYVTVKLCQPGTTNCATIDNILLDTGSSGLRIWEGDLPSGFTLPSSTVTGGTLNECLPFLDSYAWGTVATADLELAGEKAASLPVQLINGNAAPTTCSSTVATTGSPQVSSEADLGARGILGIGNYQSDCGTYCATSPTQSLDIYFACSSSAASSCTQVAVPVAQQIVNPVALFSGDNNGIAVQFPSVAAGGVTSVTGTLTFGIGTQSNNTPPSGLTVLTLDDIGNFTTTFQGGPFVDSFFDTGSNGLFFGTINSTTLVTSTGITACNLGGNGSPNSFWYCPSSELSENATIASTMNPSVSKVVSFQVGNVKNLAGAAYGDLAGPNDSSIPNAGKIFDWGLPFFFGRTVYVGLEGTSSSIGSSSTLYDAF
jgi:hypothetical protein